MSIGETTIYCSNAENPPPAKPGWSHSDRVLVHYPATVERSEGWGIAYFHHQPPFGEDPCWVDFSGDSYGRTPTWWWTLPVMD